ncbi:hypothetical protein [Paraburkholderia acidipaludis]|uniref:hypothetical protein n=1 Tax=Paraburkholderia acidipaludis TaxID=660537 RepID=UPI0004826424|nr:hypothetical protein [Paraburkholderia acidipaludis]
MSAQMTRKPRSLDPVKPARCRKAQAIMEEAREAGIGLSTIQRATGKNPSDLFYYARGGKAPSAAGFQHFENVMAELIGRAPRKLYILVPPLGLSFELAKRNDMPYSRRVRAFLKYVFSIDPELIEIDENTAAAYLQLINSCSFASLQARKSHRNEWLTEQRARLGAWYSYYMEAGDVWKYDGPDDPRLRAYQRFIELTLNYP